MIRVDWGLQGLRSLAPDSDVLVIVGVLSFTSCVEIALSREVEVLPYRWRDETAAEYARQQGAELAGDRGSGSRWSLSPACYRGAPAGMRIVLPSPNGATLSVEAAGHAAVLAGCLRNAGATARAALRLGSRVGVVAAGERWPDGSLRPCLEDWVGAGAIVDQLPGQHSAEARAASVSYHECARDLQASMLASASGQELVAKGYAEDVELASQVDAPGARAARFMEARYVPVAG